MQGDSGGLLPTYHVYCTYSLQEKNQVKHMKLEEKLRLLRKQNGLSQEQLADKLGIARQTISKWETGQAVPELNGLILLSDLYGITIDRIVKEDDACSLAPDQGTDIDISKIVSFLIRAKQNSYAGKAQEIKPSRPQSHDFYYEEETYSYYDTYLGGERFAGEEAVWHHTAPIWSMNYAGRVIGEAFSGDFLREALSHVPAKTPFRGPEIYTKGVYRYHSRVNGDFIWFQGYEEIFYEEERIYECYYHGGVL